MHDFAVRVATRGGKMTQEPLYPEGHPKRIEQDSQRANTSAPSSSKKKKKMIGLHMLLVNLKYRNLMIMIMRFLSLMLKLNLVMNTHLLIMKKIIMRFMKTLKQIIKNQIMMLK